MTLDEALQTLGFSHTDYPSEKYQVFKNPDSEEVYFLGQDGQLRRGYSISRSVIANDEIPLLLKAAAEHAESAPETVIIDAPKRKKNDTLIALLKRPEGATLPQLAAATGWQKHSVHGVMSGVLKKKLGLQIVSEKVNGERVYRIHAAVAA